MKLKQTVEQIIDGCRKGDSVARRDLYEMLAARMFGVIKRYIKDSATAEDLLHDGFVTLYTKISDYRGEGVFEAWCRKIFVNTALGYLRKCPPVLTEYYTDIPRSTVQTQPNVIERMSAEDIMKCISMLPEGYGTILNLYAVEGFSHAEIAKMLNISENTSRSQYSRARTRLSEIMMEYFKEKNGEFGRER